MNIGQHREYLRLALARARLPIDCWWDADLETFIVSWSPRVGMACWTWDDFDTAAQASAAYFALCAGHKRLPEPPK